MEGRKCHVISRTVRRGVRCTSRPGVSAVLAMLVGVLIGWLPGVDAAFADDSVARNPDDFIPQGYVVMETLAGDLNKDGQADRVFLIKGTDKDRWVKDEYRGDLDRNRRGLIIAFAEGDQYRLALRNLDCFSSDQEDGGVYFPPDLGVGIEKGNLVVSYGHGRYGYWSYTFRYQHGGFELIGYDDSENFGPIVRQQTSINFSTRKMLSRVNVNADDDGGEERFEERWTTFKRSRFISLADIDDFDELYQEAILKRVE